MPWQEADKTAGILSEEPTGGSGGGGGVGKPAAAVAGPEDGRVAVWVRTSLETQCLGARLLTLIRNEGLLRDWYARYNTFRIFGVPPKIGSAPLQIRPCGSTLILIYAIKNCTIQKRTAGL